MIGIGFGWKLGLATVSLYLFEGIIGLPVFSGTPEKGIGLIYFTGPTMGYLLGFLLAVYISGKFIYDNNLLKNFFKLLLILFLSFSDCENLRFPINFIF